MTAAARSLAAVLLLLLAGCAGDPFADYAPLDQAVQRPHATQVPQTDRSGAVLQQFDPARSFFPLGLSGALVDYSLGVTRGFNAAFLADFNAVTTDPDQPMEAQLNAADGSRLQLLRARPDDWGGLQHAALLDAGEVVVITMPRGAAGTEAFARMAREQAAKPVWALLRASARTGNGESLPDPAEARLMAYAALIAGATGLIWHGEDNYAARNAGMVGIAPGAQMDYGIQVNSTITPLKATPNDVVASRRLWDAVMQLNRRIGRIAPALLQPDAPDSYSVATRIDKTARQPARLRSLLKPFDGGLLLIVLNAGERAEDFRIGFPRAIRSLTRFEDVEPVAADPLRGLFRDSIEPHGVRLYKISLAG